jgi:predicted membrane-bound spermidine synthase
MQIQASTRRQLLLGIFVISGFTGLIYESIWTHYLKLFLGHAAYAQSLVLVIFMGGMALGDYLVTAVAAAQIRMGNSAQARALLETNWSSLQHASALQLPLRQLLAIAQSTPPQALADHEPGT